jgi:hypothetical protein
LFGRAGRTPNLRRLGPRFGQGIPPPVPSESLRRSGFCAKEELTTLDTGRDGYRREGWVVGTRSIAPCPPHGPMMFSAVERRAYVARCLRCGLRGPTGEDGVDAKRAFEEAFEEAR